MEKRSDVNLQLNHLFRRESGKMVAVLVKIFGSENYQLAEDVVQDALVSAMETWKYQGIPNNPKAWLYRAAKNKAIDLIRKSRHQYTLDFTDPERKLLTSEYTLATTMNHYWEEDKIRDDFLGMMYACCHPAISEENQKTFILKSLCGFSTREVARAFITEEQTISKRLFRTKQFFRSAKLKPVIPSSEELPSRTRAVLGTIYLIFNEGYNSTHSDQLIRQDLIAQATYLCEMLTMNDQTRSPDSYALMALMCLHASRSPARVSKQGDIVTLPMQDRSRWNQELIKAGNHYLNMSAFGATLSTYHIEAAIAYEHCIAADYESTNWEAIMEYYDHWVSRSADPVVALNRCIALMEYRGPQIAWKSLRQLENRKVLGKYYLYYVVSGEILSRLGENKKAVNFFKQASKLTFSEKQIQFLRDKITAIEKLHQC